jgi:hypothetical protein
VNTGVEGEGNREPGKARLIDLALRPAGGIPRELFGSIHPTT